MKLSVVHRTEYQYPQDVFSSFNELWICPASDAHQQVLDFAFDVAPPTSAHRRKDFYGNEVVVVNVPGHHRTLSLDMRACVVTSPLPPPGAVDIVSLECLRTRFYEFLLTTD